MSQLQTQSSRKSIWSEFEEDGQSMTVEDPILLEDEEWEYLPKRIKVVDEVSTPSSRLVEELLASTQDLASSSSSSSSSPSSSSPSIPSSIRSPSKSSSSSASSSPSSFSPSSMSSTSPVRGPTSSPSSPAAAALNRPKGKRSIEEILPDSPKSHRVWTFRAQKLLVYCVKKAGGPCRRAWIDFIKRCESRHQPLRLAHDETGIVNTYWTSLINRFRAEPDAPQLDPAPKGAQKRIYNAVTYGLQGREAMKAWLEYCDEVEAEYSEVRAQALELGTKEILDDSSQRLSLDEAKAQIEDGKRQRKDARDETYRILQRDAEAAMELRSQQVQTGRAIIEMLSRMNQTFEKVLSTVLCSDSLDGASMKNSAEPSPAQFVAPSSNVVLPTPLPRAVGTMLPITSPSDPAPIIDIGGTGMDATQAESDDGHPSLLPLN